MSRKLEFEQKVEALIREFSDLAYSEIGDSLDYYADYCARRVNRDGSV